MPKLYGTPGPRAIMPSMATSHSISQCDPMAQLLFDRLISQADDQGRLLGDPLVVKAACMPLIAPAGIKQITLWLGQLEAADLIHRYTAGGYQLLQLATWQRWQGGQRRVFPSRYPAPNGWEDIAPRGHIARETPDERPQSAGQTPAKRPQNADISPDGRGTNAGELPPRAGAYRAVATTVPLPVPEPVPVGTPPPVDAADTYWRLTTVWPKETTRTWIDEKADRFGHEAVSVAMAEEWQIDPNVRTVMGRVTARLERAERAAERTEREDEIRRNAAKREPLAPLRLSDGPLTDEEKAELLAEYAAEKAALAAEEES